MWTAPALLRAARSELVDAGGPGTRFMFGAKRESSFVYNASVVHDMVLRAQALRPRGAVGSRFPQLARYIFEGDEPSPAPLPLAPLEGSRGAAAGEARRRFPQIRLMKYVRHRGNPMRDTDRARIVRARSRESCVLRTWRVES